MTIIAFNGTSPAIAADAFVAPGARIIGNVTIGAHASIWYNCVVRGDVGAITIGARTNIQDGSVVHVTGGKYNTVIGEDCLIGHLAMIHGCTLENHAFVGLGAIVMDGCVIETDAMLAAGAMLTPGKTIPAGQMWGGRPARFMRELNESWSIGNQMAVAHYVRNGAAHKSAVDSI